MRRGGVRLPVQALAEAVHAKQAPNEAVLAEERKKKNYVEFWAVISLKDPFRLVLSEMRDRLFHTREILHHCLVHPKCAAAAASRAYPHLLHQIYLPAVLCSFRGHQYILLLASAHGSSWAAKPPHAVSCSRPLFPRLLFVVIFARHFEALGVHSATWPQGETMVCCMAA